MLPLGEREQGGRVGEMNGAKRRNRRDGREVRELTDLASHMFVAVTGIYMGIVRMYMVYVYRHH